MATIIEMVTHTRLDCVIGSAAGMRRGVAEAVWHARHRSAFGARLVEQPLMRNVLADLALESEAATATALRLARSYDEGDGTFRRFATAVLKYWICKRATPHAAESLECLGGNGYVEESPMPRLLRDSPLNGIWEGSGNVMSLDVLRAMAREPEGLPAFLAECELARGADARLDAHLDALPATLGALAGEDAQWLARRAVEDLALAFQASLLVRTAPPAVADAFCAGRLGERAARVYGTLPAGVDADAIVARALQIDLTRRARSSCRRPEPLVDSRPHDPARPARRGPGRRGVTAWPSTTALWSPGTLFFCVPGFTRDGHDFAPDAVARGAAALVVAAAARARRARGAGRGRARGDGGRRGALPRRPDGARCRVAGITGTNGKTTTAFLVRSLLEAAGPPVRAARHGQVGRRRRGARGRAHDAGGDRPPAHVRGRCSTAGDRRARWRSPRTRWSCAAPTGSTSPPRCSPTSRRTTSTSTPTWRPTSRPSGCCSPRR